ncbi:MAG: sulfate permease [Ekhidna sp.]
MKFLPIVEWVSSYRKEFLRGDLAAGVTVGIMLIPQGMAYALIAGLPPVYGLYASIVPQLIYAVFGTSRQLSVAPVAMDSLLVAAGVSLMAEEGTEAYIQLAILVAFLMGLFQLLLGVLRMGFITNLLSKPVISGFTSAAALIIGINQLKYLLGIELTRSNRIYEVVWDALRSLSDIHLLTFVLGLMGILVIKGAKRIHKSVPGALVAVALGILATYYLSLNEAGVAIVREIPEGLPAFVWPTLDWEQTKTVLPLAMTISVVAFMEAFSVSKAIEAKHSTYKVRPNQELIGLGAANFIGALFQSYPVTGGFSRSAVNNEAGANTPLSSVVSAFLIALTLLFLTPLFYYLPMAILASVIMVAVATLIDIGYVRKLWKQGKLEFWLLILTFLVTLNFSMVPGIVTGVVLSVLLLLYKSAYPHIALLGRLKGQSEFRNIKRFKNLELWDDRLVLRIDAPLTFINIQHIKEYLQTTLARNPSVKYILLDASAISHLDASAIDGLTELIGHLKEKDVELFLADVIGPVRDVLYKTGLLQLIGEAHIFLTLNDVIAHLDGIDNTERKEAALQHGEMD